MIDDRGNQSHIRLRRSVTMISCRVLMAACRSHHCTAKRVRFALQRENAGPRRLECLGQKLL